MVYVPSSSSLAVLSTTIFPPSSSAATATPGSSVRTQARARRADRRREVSFLLLFCIIPHPFLLKQPLCHGFPGGTPAWPCAQKGRGHGGGRGGVGAYVAAGCGLKMRAASSAFSLRHTLLFYRFRPPFVKSYYEKFYSFICGPFAFYTNRPWESLRLSFYVIDWFYLPADEWGICPK